MKKFLALVLALIMTMSLVTISAGAEDFADADSVTYEEAVDVMTAIGVVGGYADGTFNPQGTLTRGAAAKIICNMILGPTEAGALATVEAPFSDVPADHVFAGYIAYCVSEGIVSGYTDGTFRPAGTLTGYAFWKMLLGALGYDADIEGYVGSNFSINVAKRGLNIGLNKGLDGSFVGSKALNREEACLYAFNALKATMVDYGNKSTISVGDITVTTSAEAKKVEDDGVNDYTTNTTTGNNTMEFCEMYFSNLKSTATSDAYGRPATQWKIKAEKVGTYAETAKLTYTAEVKGTVLADDLDDAGIAAYDSSKADSTAKAFSIYINGEDCSAWGTYFGVDIIDTADIKAIFDTKTNLPFTGKGMNVEIFADSDGNLTRIAVVTPYLAEITKVEKDNASTRSVDERALNVTLKNVIGVGDKAIVIDSDVTGFDAVYSEVEKGDFVLVTPNKGDVTAINAAVDVAIPETVTGAITYVKANSKVTMAGVAYDATYVYDQSGDNFNLTSKDATLYLDANGYVIGYEGPSTTGDKAVAVIEKYETLEDGKIVSMLKGVTSDGAIVEWKYENSTVAENTIYTHDADDTTGTGYEAGNGKYVLSTIATGAADDTLVVDNATLYVGATVSIAAKDKSLTYDTTKLYFADDVNFIFVNDGKAVVKEGVQKVTSAPVYVTVDIDKDNNEFITAVYVFAAAAASSATTEDVIFVVYEATPANVKVVVDGKDKTFKAYTAYVNGEKVDDFYTAATLSDNAFWDKEVEDESKAYVESAHASADALSIIENGTVADVVAGIMSISGGADYDLDGATIVDTRTNGDIDEAAELKTNAANIEVSFIYDEDTNVVSYLYVTAK